MKTLLLILALLLSTTAFAQLPDAPVPVPTERAMQMHSTDGFFSFNDGEHVLHPNKKSWALFAGSQAAMWGATVFAVRRSARSGETTGSEYPAVAAVTALDFLSFKLLSPSFSVGPPVWAVVHYVRAGLR